MEALYNMADQGQSLQPVDINLIANDAALADDRVLWQMVRALGYSATPQKGIFTYGLSGGAPESGLSSAALVQPGNATGTLASGSVTVMPFRAMVGSQDNTSLLESMRGIRTGYLIGASTNGTTQGLAANSTGNPRWDLLYASVTPATEGPTVTRYVKALTNGVVAPTPVVVTTSVSVVLNVQAGIAASSPTRPSLPADAAGTFQIPLAYIWVPGTFTSTSTVLNHYIHECAPVLTLHSANGVMAVQPANQQNQIGGTVDLNQGGTTYRPGCYLPPTMVGGEERIILIQMGGGNGLTPASHNIGQIVDNSVDWRFRFFTFHAAGNGGNTEAGAFVSDRQGAPGTQAMVPGVGLLSSVVSTPTQASGMGQSFVDDSASGALFGTGTTFAGLSAFQGAACFISGTAMPTINTTAADAVMLYVDTSGVLRFTRTSAASGQVIIWLRASGPYSNFGEV